MAEWDSFAIPQVVYKNQNYGYNLYTGKTCWIFANRGIFEGLPKPKDYTNIPEANDTTTNGTQTNVGYF